MSEALERLRAARSEYEDARAAVEAVGEERLERLADVHDRFTELLDRYDESASGSGRETFQAYVEFEAALEEFEADLPEDVPERASFEAACDLLDRRRLEERDFERAREEIAPATDLVARLEDRERARERLREARRDVEARIDEIDAAIAEREEVLRFAGVDFDAPVDAIREPIAAYDDAVREAFRAFRSDAGAREVLDTLAVAEDYPLVDVRPPPDDLLAYLREHPAGEEPIPTLLEYAGYSRSKLAHYVEEPAAFRASVAGNRTYIERLDADPFAVGWPPPPAEELRFRARELVAVVGRFAPEEVLDRLHAVREAVRDPDYGRLREVAVARERLDEPERERLRSGAIEEEIEELRAERERLRDAT